MSMKYIREAYGVPAKRGRLVRVYKKDQYGAWQCLTEGRITSACCHIRVNGRPYHPTWNVVYLDDGGETVLMDTRGPACPR